MSLPPFAILQPLLFFQIGASHSDRLSVDDMCRIASGTKGFYPIRRLKRVGMVSIGTSDPFRYAPPPRCIILWLTV